MIVAYETLAADDCVDPASPLGPERPKKVEATMRLILTVLFMIWFVIHSRLAW